MLQEVLAVSLLLLWTHTDIRWPASSHHSENKEPVSSLQTSSPGHSTQKTLKYASKWTDKCHRPGCQVESRHRNLGPHLVPVSWKLTQMLEAEPVQRKPTVQLIDSTLRLNSPRARQGLPCNGKPGSELELHHSPLSSDPRCWKQVQTLYCSYNWESWVKSTQNLFQLYNFLWTLVQNKLKSGTVRSMECSGERYQFIYVVRTSETKLSEKRNGEGLLHWPPEAKLLPIAPAPKARQCH